MDINKAMSICFKKGIKVYPEIKNKSFVVAVNDNNKVKLSDKLHTSKTINKAIVNTYLHIAEKIKDATTY